MAFSAHILATLLSAAVLLLSQVTTARAQDAEASEAVENRTTTLVSGLFANKRILFSQFRALELMFPESEEFLAVLQSLGEIREQEQRLVALLASNQDDEQLLALRAVFEQLVLDACSLVTAKLGIPCTYDVLLKLKTEADAFNKTQNAIDRLVAFLPVNGISASSWIQANNIHCEVSAESFEIINTAHSGVLNRNDCM